MAMNNAYSDLKAVADYVCPNEWGGRIYQSLIRLELV
nr:hypothetical protein [Moraxella sp. CTOTU46711]